MDENNSIRTFFDSIIHDKKEKEIMGLILSGKDENEIIKKLLQNNGGDGDD